MATEVGCESSGYEFRAFSPADEYQALGAVRGKIRRALAVKYLEGHAWHRALTHDTMRGTIMYDPETAGIGLLVDGQFVSIGELPEILAVHEGWEFTLEFGER